MGLTMQGLLQLSWKEQRTWWQREADRWVRIEAKISKTREKYPDSYKWLEELMREREDDAKRLAIAVYEREKKSEGAGQTELI